MMRAQDSKDKLWRCREKKTVNNQHTILLLSTSMPSIHCCQGKKAIATTFLHKDNDRFELSKFGKLFYLKANTTHPLVPTYTNGIRREKKTHPITCRERKKHLMRTHGLEYTCTCTALVFINTLKNNMEPTQITVYRLRSAR